MAGCLGAWQCQAWPRCGQAGVLPALICATNPSHFFLYLGRGWESSSYPVDSQSQPQRMHLASHSSEFHQGHPHLHPQREGERRVQG